MNTGTTIVILIIAILMIVFGPLATIWSLNTLFGLGIAYTFWTWLAMAWLAMATFGSVTSSIRNKKN